LHTTEYMHTGLFKYAFFIVLYAFMKDVYEVLGCDSIAKWSVGAILGMGSTANKLLAIC
jgi:hypothetical protein